jgi:hypothetical protein
MCREDARNSVVVFITINTLHVSGGSSARHQELKTVYAASGICEACLLLPLLLVGRSPDRSPVVSLGNFSEASDKSMCPGSTQFFEMSTRVFQGVKTAGA